MTSHDLPMRLPSLVQVHVAFGRLGNCRVQAIPFDGNSYLDASLLEDSPRALGSRGLAPARPARRLATGRSAGDAQHGAIDEEALELAARSALWARLGPLIARHVPRLRAIALQVREALRDYH